MFKIPTYEELEKKEVAQSEANKDYKINLFQKRKLFNTDENDLNEIGSSTSENTLPKTSKSSITITKINIEKPVVTEPATKKQTIPLNADQDADDDADADDELLCAFIKDNKDIIEKPLNKASSSKDVPETVFKKPAPLPAPIVAKPSNVQISRGNSYSGGNSGSGALLVNSKQRGNPILKHVRNVPWNFSETLVPDYCMSRNSCAFYLSMKYHLLNPTYIHQRIKELGKAYDLRVLLVFVDVKEPRHCIKELEKISIHTNLTMILCWNSEEVGRYLETYKAYEFKNAEAIMEKSSAIPISGSSSSSSNQQNQADSNFIANYTDFLCAIKSINKTDASTLRQTFGSIKQLSKASKQELNLCPGLGPLKVNRLHEIFRAPFLLTKK